AAAPAAVDDWESQLWEERTEARPAGRPKWLVWGLVGAVVALIAIVAIVAALLAGGDGQATDTPVAQVSTETPTEAAVVVSTDTPGATTEAEPTVTQIVDVPTVESPPTVELQATAPPVTQPPPPAQQPPAQQPPTAPEDLEQLPAVVQEYLGDVPPDQLPQAIATQIQSMQPEQVQQMIDALFPGIDQASLPGVVAASFPGLSEQDVAGLLQMAFPGQSFEVPEMGPVGGRLAMGIYDQSRDVWDLYLVNAMGGQRTLVLEQASEPNFSPDAQWLVYYSWASDRLGLRLIKTDGTGDTPLTSASVHFYPTFSPDGGRISFFNSDTRAVHVVNRDGSNLREITKGEYPAWSPVGDQIVYRGCLAGGRCGLIVANADGSNPIQITTHANDAAPRWSPNGGQIAFHSDRDGNWEIYVINADGTWLRRITLNPTTDIMPVWSPDGLRIAFRSDRQGGRAVWLTSGIGGGATKLIDAGFNPAAPNLALMDWSQ
ncbi:MAG: hypothetical protein PVF47_14390, partial [Anaerolineae bacterium]